MPEDILVSGLEEFGASLDGFGRAVAQIGIEGKEVEVQVFVNIGATNTQIYSPLCEYEEELARSVMEDVLVGVAKVGNYLTLSTSIPTPEISFQMVGETMLDMASFVNHYLGNLELQNPWPGHSVPAA